MIRLIVSFLVFAFVLPAQSHWREEYAQASPQEQKWFNDQTIPGSKTRCCNDSDGTYAEQDIRNGHYWAKFTAVSFGEDGSKYSTIVDWMQVPDGAVIHDPNRHGAPVVWWYWNGVGWGIKCYAPGALF